MKAEKDQEAEFSSFMAKLEASKSGIGHRIRTVRGERTQHAFANEYGVGLSTLTRWEKGETAPDSALLAAIAEQEAVDGHWLLTGKGEPRPTGDRVGACTISEDDMDLLLDCYVAGEMILRDHNMDATHEEKKAATIKMFRRQKAGNASLSPSALAKGGLDSSRNRA